MFLQESKGMVSPYLKQPVPMEDVQRTGIAPNPAQGYQTITPPTDEDIYNQWLGNQPAKPTHFDKGGLVGQVNPYYTYVTALKNFGQLPRNQEIQPGQELPSLPQPSQYIEPVGLASLVPQQPGQPLQYAQGGMVGYPSSREIEDYIRATAAAKGINPDVAVRVWKSEGAGGNPAEGWQSYASKNGMREPSYGPYQMLVGGEGTGYGTGMGNQFMSKTGLDPRDPNTWREQVGFALDKAGTGGWTPWYGAKAAGISQWQGINGAPAGLAALQQQAMPSSAARMASATLPSQAAYTATAATGAKAALQSKLASSPFSGLTGMLAMMAMGNQQQGGGDEIVSSDARPRQPIDPERETASTSQTPDWYMRRRRMYGYG